MRRFAIFSMLVAGLLATADAAAPVQRRGQNTANSGVSGASAARSAMPRTGNAASSQATTARSATSGRAIVSRSATTQPVDQGVVARAATTQKVIGTGTKVASATKNVVVSEACQQKYDGCMDSFCMIDNASGGRCMCSDRNAELDSVLAEIEKLDQQSYQMATTGVERIEMGADADAAISAANAVVADLRGDNDKKTARQSLDLTMWNSTVDFDDSDDVWADDDISAIAGKTGDALYRASHRVCAEQIPECANEISMLQMMYSQRVKSDCAAYENSLKQQKNASANKLSVAEKALREAALEQYRTANKYDLGQCTVEFKNCMISTGGCGDDFSKCASVAASDNTNINKSRRSKNKTYSIVGATTTIEISASTYDTLISKKPLCENVTKHCVAVAGQVWDTFLREVAPQIKSAELIAEDNARQSCVSSISSCFQKACKDTIDPNDPDGSYDLCLTRPDTVLSLCKIPLNACGIDASSSAKAAESQIWGFVVARLASMRVDSCTKEVKSCLQSDDRCGKDYTQCVGLDTDTIIRMCPYDKLVGCQQVYGENEIRGDAVYDQLADMVQGIMLNIDNSMLVQCQNAANTAMIKVCGDTENCNGLTTDDGIGARSLEYKICEYSSSSDSLDINYSKCRTDISQIMDSELGRVDGSTSAELGPVTPFAGVLDGTIYWESVDIDENGKVSSVDDYLNKIDGGSMSAAQKEKVKSELAVLQKNIDVAINAIEADPTVQYCMTGREVQGMKRSNREVRDRISNRSSDNARFPGLTKQMRMIIAMHALKVAKDNYYAKYDKLNTQMLKDYAALGERMAEIQGKNALDARREIARVACVTFADASSLPKSPNPPKSAFGKIMAATALVGAAVAIPFTGGASATVVALGLTSSGLAIAGAGVAVAGIGLAGNIGSGANGLDGGGRGKLIGSKQLNQWNYKETITSTFDWETLNCHKCVRTQNCDKTGSPLFGSKYCKSWEDSKETCTDIQF